MPFYKTWPLKIMLSVSQFQFVQGGNRITGYAVVRRNSAAVICRREVGPDSFVHCIECSRTIHQREAGNIGQVDLSQFGVKFNKLSSSIF